MSIHSLAGHSRRHSIMNLEDTIFQFIQENPGALKNELSEMFGLSDYRLHRVFRHISRNLEGRTLKSDSERGVWILNIDPRMCLGYEWVGFDNGGFRQCSEDPAFPDGRCYRHSEHENPEMIAFKRRLHYLIGPCDPNPWHLTQLPLTEVRELHESLRRISPITQKDFDDRMKLLRVFVSALSWLKWKDEMRRRNSENWLPPEFEQRHRASSRNSFEYSMRRYYLILEISSDSTKEEALKAWKRLARLYHPDSSPQTGGNEEKMKEINHAKERIFRFRRWD